MPLFVARVDQPGGRDDAPVAVERRRPGVQAAGVLLMDSAPSVVRNYTEAALSHSSKLGPASFAPGFGSAAPSA
jgi:hypothetical protein